MDPNEITSLARDCYERPSLAGFIDGNILIDEHRFSISPVEAAVTEEALRILGAGSDILLETSFPTNSIPVALSVALTYQQEPRRGGKNRPVVLFPRQGYTTTFDKIHYKYTCDPVKKPGSEPIPRHPAEDLSSIKDEWGLWTANKQFRFDIGNYDGNPAAIVVDLRAPRWNDTYAPQIGKLLDELQDTPVAFIAGEKDWTIGYELAQDRTDEQVTIQPAHLEQSPIEELPVEQRTPLSETERLLATEDVTYHYYAVGDEELAELYPRFVAKKIQLQKRGIAQKAVGGLYNRLIQLPIKPKYWDRVSSNHGYFDSIPQQIDYLSTVADQYETGSSRLRNFIETARQLQAHLNDQHKLQNYLLNAVDRGDNSNKSLRLVFSNDREQEAFLLAAEKNGYSLSNTQNVILATKGDLDPKTETITMFAGAPPRNSYHYEFPSSGTVAFIYFSILDEYVKENAKSKSGGQVTHSEQSLGNSELDLEPLEIDSIEAEVQDMVSPVDNSYSSSEATTDLLGGSSVWKVDADESVVGESEAEAQETRNSDPVSGDSSPKEKLVFEFDEDIESLQLTPLSRVTLFHSEKGEIERTQAQNVEVGDTMILLDGVADDLYDLVLQSAREREQVREDENLVEGWRDQLNQVLDSGRWSRKEFHQKLVNMGSEIADPASISQWKYGSILAPQDPEDIRRVYQIAQPGLDESMFENLAKEVAAAANRLRRRHMKIGKRIRPLVEYELDASTTELPSYYDREVQKRIREDTKKVTVTAVTEQVVDDGSDDPADEKETGSTSQSTPSA